MGKNGNADRAGRSTAWARVYKDEKRRAGVRTHLAQRADNGKLSEAQREQQLIKEKREAKEAKAKAFMEQEALYANMYESTTEEVGDDGNRSETATPDNIQDSTADEEGTEQSSINNEETQSNNLGSVDQQKGEKWNVAEDHTDHKKHIEDEQSRDATAVSRQTVVSVQSALASVKLSEVTAT